MNRICCAVMLLLAGCATYRSTEDIPAVQDFDACRYMGSWYEIARLPNVFDKDFTDVTAKYELQGNKVTFVKRGFCEDRERVVTYTGFFEGNRNVGEFRLRYIYEFGLLYRVIWVSQDYDMSIVTSADRGGLWIYSREKQIPQAKLDELIKKAQDWGFDTTKLEYPQQKQNK